MRYLSSIRYIDAVVKAGSIRAAAETLAITSTALNRRILSMEEELGAPIFERLPHGVRLSAAGEIYIHHIRNQLSDMERVKSQIADLSGVRRGHVSIACSQALLPYFLPTQIALYRREHPNVTFAVHLRDREAAERALVDHSADLAIVFEPVRLTDFMTLMRVRQPVHVVMAPDHPLADRETVRLADCLAFPISLPTTPYGVRHLIDIAVRTASLRIEPVIQSDNFEFLRNHAVAENILSFQIPIGFADQTSTGSMTSRPLDSRDVPAGILYLGQLKGRTLPVAAARFAAQLTSALAAQFELS
ncbi:LysR family transcriptional regulator [Rhizobium cremeum]|uniref:LysR family transcriptional regulator n=1 Tax=Rhizobium cremeum TaxID=2813827 RepID=UPI000DD8A3F9|nr:LysR family transcriptional regulator [Rhizobium cremeum]MCJ7995331.1 LysR family transcriptional regulator [Rhizobium cremeum]MCJ8000830.1 LysR family transcriptional regulator [Rhizobium cremeum]